jgi:hypothetical protein
LALVDFAEGGFRFEDEALADGGGSAGEDFEFVALHVELEEIALRDAERGEFTVEGGKFDRDTLCSGKALGLREAREPREIGFKNGRALGVSKEVQLGGAIARAQTFGDHFHSAQTFAFELFDEGGGFRGVGLHEDGGDEMLEGRPLPRKPAAGSDIDERERGAVEKAREIGRRIHGTKIRCRG